MGLILLTILLVLLFGGGTYGSFQPAWRSSRYYGGGIGLGTVLVIIIVVLLLTGRI